MEAEKLDKIAVDAKQEEKNVGFMDPTQKTARKRGRPPKTEAKNQKVAEISGQSAKTGEQASQQQTIPTSILVRPAGIVLSGFAVEWTGTDKAAMTKEEMELFCESTGLLLDKYFPNAFSKYMPEIMFSTFLMTYSIRLYAVKKVIQEERRQAVRNPTGPVQDNVERQKFGPTAHKVEVEELTM